MYKYRKVLISVIAGLLVLLLLGGIVASAFADSSSDIKSRISALEQKEAEIAAQQAELNTEISNAKGEQLDLISRKSQIDRQLKLTLDEIDNRNAQIQEYNLLIAEQQNELDDIIAQQQELNDRYQTRIRAMEENGSVSYWSVLFKANSFADLLDRVDMVNEIAEADNRMMAELSAVAAHIEQVRSELAAVKLEAEAAKDELAEAEASLELEREEADELLIELNANRAELEAQLEYADAMQASLDAQIAAQELEYQKALDAEAAAAAAATAGSGGGNGPGGGVSASGFIWPCAARTITCRYGYRTHPVTGATGSFHTGIDIGAGAGSPIYAANSGTVTAATYSAAYGYYVTINHGNGFSTLYGHMTNYIVSAGQTVSQGQVIGYVGSTGLSTGPHLHFTVYYGGSTVNPLSYLP